jgi:hypothetical protein
VKTFDPKLGPLPAAQKNIWPTLAPVQNSGFVLYGGTAIALRLGHRESVDFDFFNSAPVDRAQLRRDLPFLKEAEVKQDHGQTFEVLTKSGVKVSFFGGLDFGRVGDPEKTSDGVLVVASLADLMATKLKTILQRSEKKDYQDIAAMVRAGVPVDAGLAAAEKLFHPTFPVQDSLRAMVYFKGGSVEQLSSGDRDVLWHAAAKVKSLPYVNLKSGLVPDEHPEGFSGPGM